MIQWVLVAGPFFFGLLALIPFLLARKGVPMGGVALSLLGLGFFLFLTAKASLIRQGKLVTFGSCEMTTRNRCLYRVGYLLMTLGTLASWGFMIAESLKV